MPFVKYLQRLRYIDQLIRRKNTGNATELGKKLNLSRSTILEYLSEMKDEGFPIRYDKTRGYYYYEEECEIPKKIFLTREEMKKLNGGIKFSSFFLYHKLSPEIGDCV